MRITRVEPILLSYSLPEPLHLDYFGGERIILKRDAMVIRMETDAGLVGWAPGQGSEAAREVIEHLVGPFLEGRVLADPDALRVKFFEEAQHAERGQYVRHTYCSVEIAMYDLLGKAAGVPVSELLGGRVRDRIGLYGSAGMYMSPEGYAAEAAAVAEMGFSAYKMRPALGPELDAKTVEMMREAVGPDMDLMVDAHTWWRMGDRSYTPETVAELAAKMSEQDIAWLEEPLSPEDHEGLQRLREKDLVPIASGEHEPNDAAFLHLINNHSVDYVQMDVVCQGGYTSGRALLPAVERAGLRFAFHSWGTALEVMAAAHLGICWPDNVAPWLEYPCHATPPGVMPARAGMYPFPLAEEILKEPLAIERGDLIVPRKPGLGVEINEAALEKYPWMPGPWSYFTMHSPRQTWAVTSDHSVKWSGNGPLK